MDNQYLIIGTSHIAKQSLHEIEKAFADFRPDFVAVELDRKRYDSLLTETKPNYSLSNIRRFGLSGYIFGVVGSILQKKLGKFVGLQPGADMLHAIRFAQKNSLKVALIDQDIETTLKRFSQEFSFREKMRIVADFFRGIIFRKRELEDLGITNLDLTKIPEKELISKLMHKLRQRYPSIYLTLVEERNRVMAKNIMHLLTMFPEKKLLVVVGAGHEEGLQELIRKHMEKKLNPTPRQYSFTISL